MCVTALFLLIGTYVVKIYHNMRFISKKALSAELLFSR